MDTLSGCNGSWKCKLYKKLPNGCFKMPRQVVILCKLKPMINPKGEVIAYCQREGLGTPEFRVQTKGAKHKPKFTCEVYLNETLLGSAEGDTKKRAEKAAAEAALEWLERLEKDLPHDTETEDAFEEDSFEGPWPIFPEVLAASMAIANERTNATLKGEKALEKIKALSLTLYKDLLEDLGDVVELDEN